MTSQIGSMQHTMRVQGRLFLGQWFPSWGDNLMTVPTASLSGPGIFPGRQPLLRCLTMKSDLVWEKIVKIHLFLSNLCLIRKTFLVRTFHCVIRSVWGVLSVMFSLLNLRGLNQKQDLRAEAAPGSAAHPWCSREQAPVPCLLALGFGRQSWASQKTFAWTSTL